MRWLLETKYKATHGDDMAKLRWLDIYLGSTQLTGIDRTLIDRIKFDREKVVADGTTNRWQRSPPRTTRSRGPRRARFLTRARSLCWRAQVARNS